MSHTDGAEILSAEPGKALRAMAGPILISLLVVQINTFADTFWCSGLGADALAALGLVVPLYATIVGIGNGVGIGVSAVGAGRIGAGNRKGASAAVTQSLPVMLAVGIALAPVFLLLGGPVIGWMGADGEVRSLADGYAFPYFLCTAVLIMQNVYAGALRAEGAARRSMYVLVIGAALNIVLDPVLAYGLGMGIAGLSWATVISTLTSTLPAVYWYHVKRDTYLRVSFSGYRFDAPTVKAVASIGVPKAVELDLFYVFNVVMLYFFVIAGGTEGVAVYNSAYKYVDLVGVVPLAFGGAMISVCSAQYGRGDFAGIRRTYRLALGYSLSIVISLTAVLFVFSDAFATVFTTGGSEDLRDEMSHALRMFCLFLPFLVLRDVGSSLLQSIRMAASSMYSALVRNIEMTIAFWIASYYTLDAEWWALTTGSWFGALLMAVWAEYGFRLRSRERATGTPEL